MDSSSVSNREITPAVKSIMDSFKDADNPLEFIKANLRTTNGGAENKTLDPVAILHEESKKIEDEKKVQTPIPPEPASKIETKSETPIEPTKAEEIIKTEPPTKEESFAALRKKLSETNATLKEREKAVEDLTKKVTKYETGEETPEPFKEKESRIRDLEKYERLHALKLSPAYKEKYIKPIESVKAKLWELGADYDIPKDVLDQALNTTNRRELNSFLSHHFDEVGALEVKELITKAQELTNAAQEAEKEPAQALQTLEEDYNRRLEAQRIQEHRVIAANSETAWIDALNKTREDGKAHELIYRENDTEFNKTYVEPIVQAAAKEYGSLVKALTDNGLTNLPKELAFALSRMVQLAHASAISIEAREAAEREAAESRRAAERDTRYARPLTSGSFTGTSGGSAQTPGKPLNANEAAEAILAKVM